MPLEEKKVLFDARLACRRILEFTAGRGFEEYRRDPMLRSAVERQSPGGPDGCALLPTLVRAAR